MVALHCTALHTFRSLCLVVSFFCVNLSQLIDTTRYIYHAVFKKTYYTLKICFVAEDWIWLSIFLSTTHTPVGWSCFKCKTCEIVLVPSSIKFPSTLRLGFLVFCGHINEVNSILLHSACVFFLGEFQNISSGFSSRSSWTPGTNFTLLLF
jgi:hypothetical protein